ncbi:MAG: cellulase family glycosylhydrolase, partial [Armatimonadetes bacterium]|nr:cellulase family glycosylhydrolase [Armatimonadota bacterium]
MPPAPASRLQHFITRAGHRLMDGEREFRFMGATMPGLFLPYDYTLQIPERMRLATPWEQADGFKTLDLMNMRVTRMWCVPIRVPGVGAPGETTWHHLQGPGQANEAAFRSLDRALALANQYGVRVILALTAAQDYFIQGGIGTYAAHRGKPRAAFYTDPQLRQDFQDVIRTVLQRRNTVTGTAYRDDKAILAWQFGNEMQDATDEWVAEMAAFIKTLDPNHLVAETRSYPSAPFFIDPNVDLYPRHYYPDYPSVQQGWIESCREELARLGGERPLLIGEFGPYVDRRMFTRENVVPKLREFLDFLCEAQGICGAILWSMCGHHEDGGFYWHQIFVYPEVWSYHWPGFASASAHGEQGILAAMRAAAFQIEGRPVAPVPPPEPPELLPVGDVPLLSWRGSAGASGYDIERAPAADGPWQLLAGNVSDAEVAYRPLFSDTTARAGDTCFYRVSARNEAGVSAPSPVVGPVRVRQVCLVDELQDFGLTTGHSAGLALCNEYNGLYAEYLFRARGDAGEWLLYRVPGEMASITVIAWYAEAVADVRLEVSADGQSFAAVVPERREQRYPSPPSGWAADQHRTAVHYSCAVPSGHPCLRISWTGPAELDRVEIYHTGG